MKIRSVREQENWCLHLAPQQLKANVYEHKGHARKQKCDLIVVFVGFDNQIHDLLFQTNIVILCRMPLVVLLSHLALDPTFCIHR